MATSASPSKRYSYHNLYHNPWDPISVHDNPYAALLELQEAWRSKDHQTPWSASKMPEIDLGDVDWRKYDPPALLRKAPNISSQILLEIIPASIENVRARVTEENRLKREAQEEEARRIAEEKQKGKGKEPYLPIIIREEPAAKSSSSPTTTKPHPHTTFETILAEDVNSSRSKAGKYPKFALRRLFHRHERGESSSSNYVKLETRLASVNLGSVDLKTQEALTALRTKLFKAPDPNELVECVSCLDEFATRNVVKVPCHSYCRDCFIRLVTAAVQNEQQWPPKCCLNQIPFKTILKNIPEDLKRTFHERSIEWEVPVSERVYCHQPECGVWVKPGQINLATRQGRCERGHLTCTICRGAAHGTNECPQDQDLNLTNLLAEEEGWKHCYSCHALVEHKEACQHMTCRCGAQFCYVCGLQWRTCGCTMQQLYAIKEAADTRREQRQLREESDAAELREILAQIEEFERQEALRLELERQEEERRAEERWRLHVKERTKQEHTRRTEVEVKYQQLREMLDELHELQQAMVDSRQEEQAKDLAAETKLVKEQLIQKQESERADLDSLMLVKMRTKEDAFAKEYVVRVAQERKMEADYLQQLQAFWNNKASGEDKIKSCMLPLQRRLDKAHRAWQQWKDEQLELCRTKLEDERTMREEIMYSTRKRTEASYADKEAELRRRIVAEKKWVQEVILERERLIGGMEVQEMEGDADSLFTPEHEEEMVIHGMA